MVKHRLLFLIAIILIAATAIIMWRLTTYLNDPRSRAFIDWWQGDEAMRSGLITTQREPCPGSPFTLPTDGYIGLVYGDPRGPYSQSKPHQGLDIFSPDRETPGLIPVYAAYDGYISRESDWRSALIQRVPEDPLEPSRQIWLYYAHMADQNGNDFIEEAFPPGAREIFVERGTLLGYTGNYNGDSSRSIWVHLHFSIVRDNGSGRYLNELEFENTLDPSPYLGMPVNYKCAPPVPSCSSVFECR